MKQFQFLAGIGLAMLATACSNEMPQQQGGADGTVTISLTLPTGMGSRAYGDGLEATSLSYAIYDAETKTLVASADDAAMFTNLNATLQVNLVNGRSYDFVFWADCGADSPYTFTAAENEADIKVDMTFSAACQEKLDAFYGNVSSKKISGPTTVSATLIRPFAQINLGTDDLSNKSVETAYGDNMTIGVTTTSYTSMNPLTGKVLGDLETVTFAPVAAPEGETFPKAGYEYLSMIYVLADTKEDVADFTYSFYSNGTEILELPVANVPLQRNYRTNIYGSILTSPTSLNITINPVFETEDYNRALVVTPGAFAEAITNPAISKIEVAENLDLSNLSAEDLAVTTPKTINIPEDKSITLSSTNPMVATSDLVVNGGTIESVNENLGAGQEARTLVIQAGGNLEMNDVTLIGNMDQKYHGNYNTATLTYYGDAEININNCKIYGAEFAICGTGANNQATVNLTNTYIESTSTTADGTNSWAYATRLWGKQVNIKDCTVVGVQGALSIDGGANAVIDGGVYYTHNSPGKTDAFYAVYATNAATVTINNGYFYSPNKQVNYIEGTSCVVGGDNDTDKPLPNIIINGGYYSGQPYNHVTKELYGPSEGHEMISIDETIDGRKYIFEVK